MVPELVPKIGEYVVCKPLQQSTFSNLVSLVEYGELRGVLPSEECCNNDKGKIQVAQVVNVDAKSGLVTLCQQGCTLAADAVQTCLERYKQRCKVHEVVRRIAQKLAQKMLDIYVLWGVWDWTEEVFRTMAISQDMKVMNWDAYPYCTIPALHRDLVYQTAQEVFETSKVCQIRGQAYLVYYGVEGIQFVKQMLQKMGAMYDIHIQYVGNGTYSFTRHAKRYDVAFAVTHVQECMQQAVNWANQHAYGGFADSHIVQDADEKE